MLNIEELKPQIIKALMPLQLDNIILFGSYAYGHPNKDSDIDLFISKDDSNQQIDAIAMVKLRGLMKKYKVGFDVISGRYKDILDREDPFYKIDILQKGIRLYG